MCAELELCVCAELELCVCAELELCVCAELELCVCAELELCVCAESACTAQAGAGTGLPFRPGHHREKRQMHVRVVARPRAPLARVRRDHAEGIEVGAGLKQKAAGLATALEEPLARLELGKGRARVLETRTGEM
jgi:hypothetical protein